jgi:hypothetical protein
MKPDKEMLEVTIYDGKDNIVEHFFTEAQTATQEEIDEMVYMINHGTPAHLAVQLVKLGRPKSSC